MRVAFIEFPPPSRINGMNKQEEGVQLLWPLSEHVCNLFPCQMCVHFIMQIHYDNVRIHVRSTPLGRMFCAVQADRPPTGGVSVGERVDDGRVCLEFHYVLDNIVTNSLSCWLNVIPGTLMAEPKLNPQTPKIGF